MLKTQVVGLYPKTKTDKETGAVTKTVIFKHILIGAEEEIAKFIAYQESQGYPVNYDEQTNKPMLQVSAQTGVHGEAHFAQAGNLYLKDDTLTMLEADMSTEDMPEMRQEIAREIRALKRTRRDEITEHLAKLEAKRSSAPTASTPTLEEEPEL